MDVYRSLPLPATAAVDQEPVATGDDDLTAVFWVKDEPEAVASFYSSEMTKVGWTLDSNKRIVTDNKDDGTQAAMTQLVFVRQDQRLIVGIAPNVKYLPLGSTHLGLTLQPL